MEIAIAVLAFTVALLLVTNTRTASMLLQANKLRLEDADRRTSLISTSDRLLAANEEMSRAGISAERIEETVKKNPKLIPEGLVRDLVRADPDMIPVTELLRVIDQGAMDKAVVAFLKDKRIQHNWKVVGKLREVQKKAGTGRDRLGRFIENDDEEPLRTTITEKCQHCDLIHRYVVGNRADETDEGYFRGGIRVGTDGSRPECIQVEHAVS